MKLLFLRLEGVMQSWGEHSKWDERDSALMPTKSGVIGLIACALGYRRGDPRIVDLSHKLTMAVRADRPGEITIDFHTVQGMPSMLNSEGKKRQENTIISHRHYLQDAAFLVVLSGAEETLESCAAALKAPIYPPFLGRKSCPPTVPLMVELNDRYDSLQEALEKYPRADRSHGHLMTQIETPSGTAVRRDNILNSAQRHFARRTVALGSVNPSEVSVS